MATIAIDFSICCSRDEIYLHDMVPSFVVSIVREAAACLGRPVDIALYNRDVVQNQLTNEVKNLFESTWRDGLKRTWKNVTGDLAAHCGTETLIQDDLVIIMPFQGVVTQSRMRNFMKAVVLEKITLSTRITAVNKNPFWLHAIYPEFREKNVVRDVNLTKLPRLQMIHFKEEAKRELLNLPKINGSHDLPKVYEIKDAFIYIPATLIRSAQSISHQDFEIVVPNAGESKPHLFYMLPILNCNADASLSFGQPAGKRA